MNIPTKPLGEIVKLLSGGTPSKQNSDYWDGEIPWVSSKEMGPPFLFETEARVTEHGAKNGTRVVPPDTILMVVRGMSLAKEFRVSLTKRTMTFNQDLKAVEPTDCVNPIYLFYVLRALAPAIQGLATEASHGTKKLETPVLQRIKIPLPESQTQTRIAKILSAYDDLIEVNRRRMSLLEEAARELYREWFVRLRFPGHESTPIRNGVPEGWERARVADAIELNPRTKIPHGEVVFVPMSCLSENSMLIEDIETKDQASGAKFRRADTLLARITPCLENGKTAFVNFLNDDETACGSTEFIVMRGRKLPPEMVYLFARTENFRAYAIASMTGSSGRQRVQTDALEDLDVLVPTTRILEQFTDQARPAFGEIEILQNQNTLLAEARDHLLPRLMRGEIEVSGQSFAPAKDSTPATLQ